MTKNQALIDVKVEGTGSVSLPPGMTQEEAERRVREADEQRKKDQ